VTHTLVTRTLDHGAAPSVDAAGNPIAAKRVLARGEAVEDAAASRSITALSWVEDDRCRNFGIVAAFSDGTLTSWRYRDGTSREKYGWEEHVLIGHDPLCDSECHSVLGDVSKTCLEESIADISAISLNAHLPTETNPDGEHDSSWLVASASSQGVILHISHVRLNEQNKGRDKPENARAATSQVFSKRVNPHAASSVQMKPVGKRGSSIHHGIEECYLFAGSASPRHNKVWVYSIPYGTADPSATDDDITSSTSPTWATLPLFTIREPIHHGFLLGHQDWITCFAWLPDFRNPNTHNENDSVGVEEAILASSGHDAKIRLWKFTSKIGVASSEVEGTAVDETIGLESNVDDEDDGGDIEDNDEDEANIDDLEEEEGEARLTIRHAASSGFSTTAISLEALLLGHEEAVTSLNWREKGMGNKKRDKPCLLSSSMDRTILIWMEEENSADDDDGIGGGGGGVWVPISRVGSAGGILGGSIGSSIMGFVDARFSPDHANRIVGHGYGGSLHFWTQDCSSQEEEKKDDDDMMEEGALVSARWVANPCVTGHFRSVEDLAWDPEGEYLLTTSSDQTTRLWSEVSCVVNGKKVCRWMEVGRPQVHGYDMTSIACIGRKSNHAQSDDPTAEKEPQHRFVSGADEKVLRVFDAPASTLRLLHTLKKLRDPATPTSSSATPAEWRVERAFLPSLGLSNKATVEIDVRESNKFAGPTIPDEDLGDAIDPRAEVSMEDLKLPMERDLGATMLWPETRKLFGHDSEVVCLDSYLASSGSDAPLVASSCKAKNDVASAAIRLWNVKLGKCVGILKGGHRSTVSTLSFSRDGKYLASSGKDRRICIWKKSDHLSAEYNDSCEYQLTTAMDSAHKRIVWSVHFCPGKPNILVSGSRDGFVKLWRIVEGDDGSLDMLEMLKFEPLCKGNKKSEPVTAVSFADFISRSDDGIEYGLLSIGTECGRVEVWKVPISENDPNFDAKLVFSVPANECHFDSVKKIAWRPVGCNGDEVLSPTILTFATCGEDCGVRIFMLQVSRKV